MASGAGEDSPAVQAVLAALDALYKNPDNRAKGEANTWLQSFQKTSEAWQTANTLLLSQSLPIEPRLFAAQTFRVKSTYDVDQIPRSALPGLRATLLTALQAYTQGPRVIQTQICLALAGLALQLRDGEDPEWGDDVVGVMIDRFGSVASDVTTLLEFLTVLPEEVTSNQRIPVDTEQYNVRSYNLLQRPALNVLKTLSMYVQAQGVTQQIQSAVFACLASWLKAGEISIQALLPTPLFSMSFDSLANDQLFDVAVDVVCDIINETQELEDNQEAIQLIVARLLPLRSELQKAIVEEDDDKVRGFCRVFVQAGETYHKLILDHRDVFFPIVEAIFECVRYNDFDIVQITFRFWYCMSVDIDKARTRDASVLEAFAPVYQQLLESIIKHLRFPDDMDSWTGQERDDFKSFRHYMGDTLKDCCQVLGSQTCLARSLSMIQNVLSKGSSASGAQWQDVEAPLFSMRAMGAKADPHDDEILPRIIDILPSLPSHPKLNYAALLVIARYTEWVRYHPDRIPALLSYISAGFSSGDVDVAAAAAQALTYLGQDCDEGLAPFLPQLYDFYQTIVDKVDPEDGRSIAEAIAYVIAGMPIEQALEPLVRFTQPLVQSLSTLANDAQQASKADLQRVADKMEQLERFVFIVGKQLQPNSLPRSCESTCQETYAILDAILARYGSTFFLGERACELIRRGLMFFDELALCVVPALLDRLASLFEQTGFASYIWIIGKTIDTFSAHDAIAAGQHADASRAMQTSFESVSRKVFATLETSSPADIPDVMDDYIHTCTAVVRARPNDLLGSPTLLSSTWRVAVSILQSVYQPNILEASLDFVRSVIDHDVFEQAQASPQANLIQQTIGENGATLLQALLHGMVNAFDPDTLPSVLIVARLLAVRVGAEAFTAWTTAALTSMSDQVISPAEKQRCLERVQSSFTSANLDGVKQAFRALYNASRKARERARLERQQSANFVEEQG